MTKEEKKALAHLESLVDWMDAILNRYAVTQTEIALDMGITNATLSQLLTGKTYKPHQLTVNAMEQWLTDNSDEYPMSKAYLEGGV